MLGFYISGHPLDDYREDISKISNFSSNDFEVLLDDSIEHDDVNNSLYDGESKKLKDGQYIKIVGLISGIRTKVTKNGDVMAFLDFEDLDGTINVIVFAKTFSQYKNLLYEDAIVYMEGRLNLKENDEPSVIGTKFNLIADEEDLKAIIGKPEKEEKSVKLNIVTLDNIENKTSKKLVINISNNLNDDELSKLRYFIKNDMGMKKPNTEVKIKNAEKVKLLNLYTNPQIMKDLITIVGRDNIKWDN